MLDDLIRYYVVVLNFTLVKMCVLVAASYVRPPVEIINALFEVGRAIWKFSTIMPRIPIWAMPSKDNSTPFLVACSTGTSFEGIRRYLAEIDHYIEQQWVSPYARMLVLHPDNQGTTPLRGWSSFHNRKWIYFPNANLTDYIDVATRMLWHATRSVYPEYPITKEMILLRSTQIASQFPESLIHLLFADDDNEILAMSRDFKRRMPLHNAIDAQEATPGLFYDLICYGAKETVTAESLLTYECNHCHERNRICMIELLLTWYPNAARENYPSGGQTPLCRALSRGDHWHTPHSERGVIQMLCDSAPDKLEEIDSETGLYPFMLAATIHGECSSETDVVDTIYQLLRHHPQPIIDSLQQN
jgi:hypothetical protein